MENKLKEIAALVAEHNQEKCDDFSLLSGNMGEILFLYYYSLLDKEYEEKATSYLNTLLENISLEGTPTPHTYCNGLAGLGIGLYLLEEGGFIENPSEVLEEVDYFLAYALQQEINFRHYDFLHGMIGIGFYFLKHYKSNPEFCLKQIEKIFIYLKDNAIEDAEKNLVKWEAIERYKFEGKNPHAPFNISLSHGIASILIFLSRIVSMNLLENEPVREILDKGVNYIFSQRIDQHVHDSYFPGTSLESSNGVYGSRLGWCYGDLGVALALWHSGKALQREDAKDLAKEVFTFAAHRTDLQKNSVLDADLCHGSSGIGQIFFRMHMETGIPELYNAYEYWKQQTFNLGCHEDGLAGYSTYQHVSGDNWINNYGVLCGISGIGLFLLSTKNPDWDEVLLLSFK